MVAPATDPAVHTAQAGVQRSIVVLTTGTRHAAGILEALRRHDVRPSLIVLERPRGRQLMSRIGEMRRRRGLRATLGAIGRRVLGGLSSHREPWRGADFYAQRADRLVIVDSLTGDEALSVLRELQPDLLLLAGAPILPAVVLELPRVGTLNAHPGLLPRYRGVDVVPRAVLNGDPVGATVHYVDAGIDTGRIVSRVEVPIRAGDSLASLQERVETAGGIALAQAVKRLLVDGTLPTETQAHRHPLCRRLTPAERRTAEARLGGRR